MRCVSTRKGKIQFIFPKKKLNCTEAKYSKRISNFTYNNNNINLAFLWWYDISVVWTSLTDILLCLEVEVVCTALFCVFLYNGFTKPFTGLFHKCSLNWIRHSNVRFECCVWNPRQSQREKFAVCRRCLALVMNLFHMIVSKCSFAYRTQKL